jgi:TolB-like protein
VLPFADMSPDGDQEYFSSGITEEILNVLAKVAQLRVAARTSTFALQDKNLTAAQWGDTLRVAYLIEGSVRKSGDQVRITAQLIDTADGSHLWTEAYTRPLDDVFQIQAGIAEAIAEALTVPLGLEGASGLVTPTADLEAYDLYLAGRSRLRLRGPGTFDAIELFEAAVARDSGWAPAWAGLADALEISTWQDSVAYDSAATYDKLARAEQAARRALELQPNNSTALVALGSIHRDRHQWAEAEGFYRRALDLDPDNAEAHQQYGEWLYKRGRIAEAVRSLDRASALDPAPIRISQLAYVLRQDGRWDEAEEVHRWAVAQGLDQQYAALASEIRALPFQRAWEEGRYEDWLVLQLTDEEISPADTVGAGAVIEAFRAGRWDLIPDTLQEEANGWWPAHQLIVLNEPDRAVDEVLRWRGVARPHGPEFVWDPAYDAIRSDPRFLGYVESIGLGGLRARRTAVAERVRPAILQQADSAAGVMSPGVTAP